ncbi:MAG: hypothetical protein PHW96_00990 [Candidatus Nanoarchaeia archaeon]|nr:hypothetical protein [Candidatus Nanoarchaeia archaeon]
MECTFCGEEEHLTVCESCKEPFCKYCGERKKRLCESCASLSGKAFDENSDDDSFDDASGDYF